MSLADKLTYLRILLIPVMIACLYIPVPYMNTVAAVIYAAAGITDILDGYFARKQKTVSDVGKIMDPIADKLITLAALFVLVERTQVPAWVGMFIVGREILICGVRLIVLNMEGKVIAASWLGKCKTTFQDIAVTMLILQMDLTFFRVFHISWIFLGISLIFTLWSTIDYCVGAYKSCKES